MTMGRVRELLAAMLFALLALASTPASAQTRLEPCVAREGSDPRVIPYGSRALAFDCEEAQERRGPGNFLVEFRFAPIEPRIDDPLVFRMTSVWQDRTVLRFRYADGSEREVAYTQAEASRYLKIGALFEIPVPRHSAALSGLEIETTGTANLRGAILGTSLMPRSASGEMNDWLIALYAGFAGLSLALIAYNLALWAALRHRFQLIYCAMVATITAYMFTSSGGAIMMFPELSNHDRLRLNYVLLAMSGIVAMRFILHFFETGILPSWLRRTINVISVLAAISAGLFAVLAPTGIWWIDRFYMSAVATLVILVFPVVYFAWRNQSNYLWMFVLAWSPPILTSVLRAFNAFGLLPYSFWLDNGNLIALAVEALLSSMMITSRLRELSQDRDLALAGERTALRLAGSDPLTGLLNRRAFLEKAIGRDGGYRLMLLDIDHFKAINDRLGHEAGDQVLRALAEVIQAERPRGSLAVRLGGEEFALLVPLGRESDCQPDKLVCAVRAKPMPLGQAVTVSLGFADGQVASEEDWKRLYRLADAALYRAKSDGRDRACRATDFRPVRAALGS